ncbi:XdhC family protein [Teredinibacter turnerae]|uniref:XdhC family protein n=1 Tax=Teredinibacter turnerae TaxID=2426 RepID=UPI00036CA1D9|nr:XdhC family protein [Teredinibacter turnerae]
MSFESSAERIVRCCCEAIAQGEESLWLTTVLRTWGSSPRPPGAMMLWSPSTGAVGSVSGGCVEEDLFARFNRGEFSRATPSRFIYGGGQPSGGVAIRLPCGGELELLIEPITSAQLTLWQALSQRLLAREPVWRHVSLVTGQWQLASEGEPGASEAFVSILLGPTRKLLIIGANAVAACLAYMARALDFYVEVCDPGEITDPVFRSGEHRLRKTYPDGFIAREFGDTNCAIVAVSHDPRLDDMALLEALPSNAFYIGAMGSMQSSIARRERLESLDITASQLHKLRAPIGIDIGSKTPQEIALSIAADLVSHYRSASPEVGR